MLPFQLQLVLQQQVVLHVQRSGVYPLVLKYWDSKRIKTQICNYHKNGTFGEGKILQRCYLFI